MWGNRHKICVYRKKVVSLRAKYGFMKKWIVLIVSSVVFCGCAKLEEKRLRGVVAEYNGEVVPADVLDRLTAGLNSEDSSRVAEQYIRQWAASLLMWDAAMGEKNEDIERQVESYRRSLYQHAWEQRIVDQRMSRMVGDSIVVAFYEANKRHFVLRESLVRGVFLVLPLGAPKQDELRKQLATPTNEENIEWIEKYAYQYASGYELFVEDWRELGEVMQHAPFEQKNVAKQLKAGRLLEQADTVNTYMLQVTEVCFAGDYTPMDYVRKEIEEMILSERRVDFIRKVRQELYNEALEQGKLKRYEK